MLNNYRRHNRFEHTQFATRIISSLSKSRKRDFFRFFVNMLLRNKSFIDCINEKNLTKTLHVQK